jgi:hypothetical protein
MTYIEKRRYYRINDVIGLNYCLAEADDEQSVDNTELARQLPQAMASLDREFNDLANVVSRENMLLSEALRLLNKKIELLTDLAAPAPTPDSRTICDTPVSISACGMAFFADREIELGARIRLRLRLGPTKNLVKFDARVVACEHYGEADAPDRLLRVEFIDIDYLAQEELIQHIVQRQCVQLAEVRAEAG